MDCLGAVLERCGVLTFWVFEAILERSGRGPEERCCRGPLTRTVESKVIAFAWSARQRRRDQAWPPPRPHSQDDAHRQPRSPQPASPQPASMHPPSQPGGRSPPGIPGNNSVWQSGAIEPRARLAEGAWHTAEGSLHAVRGLGVDVTRAPAHRRQVHLQHQLRETAPHSQHTPPTPTSLSPRLSSQSRTPPTEYCVRSPLPPPPPPLPATAARHGTLGDVLHYHPR